MARGDRSQPERTSEQRERDRLERERRRAERAGATPPAPAQPDPADPLLFEEPAHADLDDPGAELPGEETRSVEQPAPHELSSEEAYPERLAPNEPLAEGWPPAPPGGHEPGEASAHEPGAHEPRAHEPRAHEASVEQPPAAHEHFAEVPPAHEPFAEEPSAEEPFAAHEPLAVQQAAEPEPVAEVPSTEPEAVAEGPPVEPEPSAHERPVEAGDEPLPADAGPASPDPDATQGYEIPGLPPADPAPPPRERLPAPPPRVRAQPDRPTRRAFRRESSAVRSVVGGGAGGSLGARRRRARGPWTRLLALIALLVVAAAIVLAVRSLKGSSSPAKAPVAAAHVVKVLIPEGKTRVQIAQIAKADGLTGSYRAAAKRSDLLDPTSYGAPKGTPDLEGFLFPATYDMDRGAPASRLVEEQLTAFQENFGAEDASRAKALGVTPYQLLTVASMVEREAQVPGDRAKIAAVIYNRLKAGMPLGIDASIYYAVEMQKNVATYTHELTESQLQINSPYNTRTHTGLPPTPISNPGTASIQAAAHPTHASYLYYVAAADGCGEQVFSTTQSAFEANVAAYEAAKQKNGGHPPACKHK